jgi:hypothetical protein
MSFGYGIDYNNDFINHVNQTHLLINFKRKNVLFSFPLLLSQISLVHFFKSKMLNFEKEKNIKGCVLKRRVKKKKKNFLFVIIIIAYASL